MKKARAAATKDQAQASGVPKTALGPSGSVSLTRRLRAANYWREQFNPLRLLTIPRAVYLIESYTRGWMADLQWTMGAPFMGIENSDADLLALIERRTSAICELDWDVKAQAQKKDGPKIDEKLAEEQKACLREKYDKIDNLVDSFEHNAMATFRGYAHCEKWTDATGDIVHLEVVDQWNVIRDGIRPGWKYNPTAVNTSFSGLPAENLMLPENFLYREVKRPVNRIALIKFIRQNLSDKDWDAFIEIYGIPGGVIIGPPNVPVEKEAQYADDAAKVAEGGSGYMPHGSEYKPNTSPHGNNPFYERLEYLSDKLILAGTGGLLTMKAMSGSGTLAGNAHQETFEMLARAEGRKISQCYQRDIDTPYLEKFFPGQPKLAYFQLATHEETDVGQVIDYAFKLARGGYQIEAAELAEKTGFNLTDRPPVDKSAARAEQTDPPSGAKYATGDEDATVANRRAIARDNAEEAGLSDFLDVCLKQIEDTDDASFQPLIERLEKIEQGDYPDLDAFKKAIRDLMKDIPAMAAPEDLSPKAVEAWEKITGAALANGLTEKPATEKGKTS